MKRLTFLPVLLAFASVALVPAAFAAAAFSDIDTDGDGVLSIPEAQAAFPDLLIVDANMDELLNAAEIQSAVPGLELNALEPETAALGEAEYQQVVDILEVDAGAAAGAAGSVGSQIENGAGTGAPPLE